MKFIHAADIHLGADPERGNRWGINRKKEIRDSFQRLILEANRLNVDFLFLSGDIFHKPPSIQELRELDYILGKLTNTKTILIAGNHDHLFSGSAYESYEFQSRTYVLKDEKMKQLYFIRENTYVYGFSYWDQEITEPRYENIRPVSEEGIHILLAHGGDAKHIPIDFEQLKWSGFDYIALGHIHKPQIIYEDLMAYPGSLEPLDATEMGAHGYLFGEITEEKQIVTFIPFSGRCYIDAEIVVYDTMSAEEIYDTIETELMRMGSENLFHLHLTGSLDPKIQMDLTDLKSRFMIVSVDTQMLTYGDYEEMFAGNHDNLIGAVMEKLQDNPKALSYAMKALLSTADE